jgi:hypothetical protein
MEEKTEMTNQDYHSRVKDALDRENFEKDNTHGKLRFSKKRSVTKSKLLGKKYPKTKSIKANIHVSDPKNAYGEHYHSAFHEIGHLRVHTEVMHGRISPPINIYEEEKLANKYAQKNVDILPSPLRAQANWAKRANIDTYKSEYIKFDRGKGVTESFRIGKRKW